MKKLADISQFENLGKQTSSFGSDEVVLFNGFFGNLWRKVSGQERREREQEEERQRQIEENRRLGQEKRRERNEHMGKINAIVDRLVDSESLSGDYTEEDREEAKRYVKDDLREDWWLKQDFPDESVVLAKVMSSLNAEKVRRQRKEWETQLDEKVSQILDSAGCADEDLGVLSNDWDWESSGNLHSWVQDIYGLGSPLPDEATFRKQVLDMYKVGRVAMEASPPIDHDDICDCYVWEPDEEPNADVDEDAWDEWHTQQILQDDGEGGHWVFEWDDRRFNYYKKLEAMGSDETLDPEARKLAKNLADECYSRWSALM